MMNATTNREIREGLMLCMLLTALVDGEVREEELSEITNILQTAPEFDGSSAEEFTRILEKVRGELAADPGKLLATIARLLPGEEHRRRGLDLATQVVTSDGIVSPDSVALIRHMVREMDLPAGALEEAAILVQPRLVRFMMIYLMYLTATADGETHPAEFEEMLPFALSLPCFKGMTTDQFAFISHSVRRHLAEMRDDWGLDYITGTLRRAAELLEDDSIPEQALRLVARGLFADGEIRQSEREFFLNVASKLKVQSVKGEEIARETVTAGAP